MCSFKLLCTVYDIKLDGTGDFTTIQDGIDAASYSASDTILVYPGTYFENINFNSKTITVASLYILTHQDSFINNTIIDGNQNGSVVQLGNSNDDAVLNGFTIQNGSGTEYYGGDYPYLLGGGIYSSNSNVHIENCLIQNNIADDGGGIRVDANYQGYANVHFKNCTIRNNHALFAGGGISIATFASATFDTDELCNIYSNTAGSGSDIIRHHPEGVPIDVIVDTFSVMNPDNYFFQDYVGSTFTCQNAKYEPVDHDLYVSPNGEDTNSGLSFDDPLKTITYAIRIIKSDSLSLNTIYLDEGLYSASQTGELFPINLRDFVSIIGSGMESTILDGEYNSNILFGWDNEINFLIKNMTVQHSNDFFYVSFPAIFLNEPSNVNLNNLRIYQNRSEFYSALEARRNSLYASHLTSIFLDNIIIEENEGMKTIAFRYLNLVEMENSIIRNNLPNYNCPQTLSGGALVTVGDFDEDNFYFFKNIQVSDNIDIGNQGMSSLALENSVNVSLINCTFANNSSNTGRAILFNGSDCQLNLYNTIIYGDENQSIKVTSPTSSNLPHTVNVTNSCILNGIDAFHVYGNNVLNWNNGNIDADPFWLNTGGYPYSLLSSSPCINTGTPDTTGLMLPNYDLAGNDRVYEDYIDMGAYEWQGVGTNDELEIVSSNLSNHPNPFNPSTTISFSVSQSPSIVEISIYNLKGQKIKTLPVILSDAEHFIEGSGTANSYSVVWNGTDQNNKPVSSGIYFARLKTGKVEFSRKMLLLK